MFAPSGPALSFLNDDVIIFASQLPLSPEFLSRVKDEVLGASVWAGWTIIHACHTTVSQTSVSFFLKRGQMSSRWKALVVAEPPVAGSNAGSNLPRIQRKRFSSGLVDLCALPPYNYHPIVPSFASKEAQMVSWCESVEMHQYFTSMPSNTISGMLDRFKYPLYYVLNYLLELIPKSFNQLINHRLSAKQKVIHPIQAYQLII